MILRRLTDERSDKLALGVWAVLLIVLSVIVAVDPHKRTVTGAYREAAARWLADEDIYLPGIHGFLYLPHAAILYAPFTLGPTALGEVAYRWAVGVLLVSALWRLAHLMHRGPPHLFLIITLLVAFSAVGNLRNGQGNAPLAALMIHAAVDIARRRWWPAAAWLVLGVAVKPLALVMLLLAGAVHWRQMSWRLGLNLLVLAALPFAFGPPGYAAHQYALCLTKLRAASTAPPEQFIPADLTGMIYHLHLILSPEAFAPIRRLLDADVFDPIRLLFAAVTLCLAFVARRRLPGPAAALALLTLAAAYLMLFNPRTEVYTYVLLTPALALYAAMDLTQADPRASACRAGILLALTAILLGLSNELMHPFVSHWAGNWINPLLTIAFLIGFVPRILRAPARPAPEG